MTSPRFRWLFNSDAAFFLLQQSGKENVKAAEADQPPEELLRRGLRGGLPRLRWTPTRHYQSKCCFCFSEPFIRCVDGRKARMAAPGVEPFDLHRKAAFCRSFIIMYVNT